MGSGVSEWVVMRGWGICLFSLLPQFLRPTVQRVYAAALRQRYVFIIERMRILAQKLRLFMCFLCDSRRRLVICAAFTRLLCASWRDLCKVKIGIREITAFEMKDGAAEKENRSMKIVLLRFEICAYRNFFPLIIRVLCDARSGMPQRG